MSFLTSLFLVVFLIGGPCLPQEFDPFALLRITLEAIGEKQDMILQRLDEQKSKMEINQKMMQDCRGELNETKIMLSEIDNSTSATNMVLREYFIQKESQSPQCPPRTIEEDGNTTDSDTRTIEEDGNTTDSDTRRTMGSNCKEVLENGGIHSGVYTITPKGFSEGVKVYCDQVTNGGGWTVILERKRPAQINFTRSFEEYAAGFGDPNGELWIGNRVLHSMTGNDPSGFTLRVEATGVEGEYYQRFGGSSVGYGGSRYGIWEYFSVGGEDTQFKLSVGGYDASSSTLGDALSYHNNMKFSTYDRDNDLSSWRHCCSTAYGGKGGWWFKDCYETNPTAPLGDTLTTTSAKWNSWNKANFWDKGSSSGSHQLISTIQFKIRK